MSDDRCSTESVIESISQQLQGYPFLAIVAFASRFIRRVEPLTEGVPQQHLGPFNLAVYVTEQYANKERGAIDATWAAIEIAEAAAEAAWAVESSGSREALKGGARALMAAEAAVRAMKAGIEATEIGGAAAVALAHEAATWAARTVSLAITAAAEAIDAPDEIIIAAVLSDLDHLETMVLDPPGTHGMPIDPSESGHLGPLWPEGTPEWFSNPMSRWGAPASSNEPAGRFELVFEIGATDVIPDRDFIRMVGQVIARADEIHRSLGGHGLKADDVDFDDGAFSTAEVYRG
jgi:hypothetical protein